MKKENEKKVNKNNELTDALSVKEIIGYAIAGLIAAFGLVLIILNIVGSAVNNNSGTNPIKVAESNLISALNVNISFLGYGLIFFALGIIILLIVLAINAKKTDRLIEKQIRRQQRLQSSALLDDENKNEVVDAEIVNDEPVPTISAKEQ